MRSEPSLHIVFLVCIKEGSSLAHEGEKAGHLCCSDLLDFIFQKSIDIIRTLKIQT